MQDHSARILIIEDEERIAHWVQTYFERNNFTTLLAFDGWQGLKMARSEAPDLIVLDLMLPGIDGVTLCRTLRTESDVPIIMLTAKDAERDRIQGLKIGADDYVTKPFSPNELVARAEAILRRISGKTQTAYCANGIVLDSEAHTCTVRDELIALSPTHFALLETFLRHKNQVLSREQLLAHAFAGGYDLTDRTIDAHIHRLRTKIEPDPKNPTYIQTVYGVGYQFIG